MSEPSTLAAVAEQRAFLAERLGSRALSDIGSGTILVFPSLSFPLDELRKIVGIQHYEERLMFMTLLLRNPNVRVVYVTSVAVDPVIVDYYLSFLDDPASARERLTLFSADDPRPHPLAQKLLDRPELQDEIKSHLTEDSFVLAFNVTESEWHLFKNLGVVVYGPHPALNWLGSKSGSRRVAQQAGVPILPGAADLMSLDEVEQAVISLAEEHAASAVIKLNNGFSGQGNAVISLDGVRKPLIESETTFCAEEESWPSFERKIAREGAVVEKLLREPGTVSPSVQMRIGADASVEVVSTHDQILGGPDDQVYLGCRFPARSAYRRLIQDHGRRIAGVLAENGVVGSFGIDFVIEPGSGAAYLSEINLRLGGTSHPFYMARFVTQGHYDEDTGRLIVDGQPKYYVGSDNLKSDRYIGLRPEQVIAQLDRAGLAYDARTKTGVTLHLLGALKDFGKFGCVAIADSRQQAEELYAEIPRVLDNLGD